MGSITPSAPSYFPAFRTVSRWEPRMSRRAPGRRPGKLPTTLPTASSRALMPASRIRRMMSSAACACSGVR